MLLLLSRVPPPEGRLCREGQVFVQACGFLTSRTAAPLKETGKAQEVSRCAPVEGRLLYLHRKQSERLTF